MKRQFAKFCGILPLILCSLFCMFPAWANEDVVASVGKNEKPFWLGVYYSRELSNQKTFTKTGE